jgi:quercetin dioxygenase-like cupin family protein
MKSGDHFEIPHEGETWTIVRSAIHDGPPFIADVAIAAGKGPPTHFHPHEDEELEVFEGSVTFYFEDGPKTLRAGDRLTIRAGTRHRFKAGPDGVRARGSYSGARFEGLIAQLPPGDKRGFVRMIQHARHTRWSGSRLTSPVLRAILAVVGGIGWLCGVRRRDVTGGTPGS